jgi:hypothetical protein
MVANLNGNGTALATTESTALARYEQPTRRVSLMPRDMDEAWLFCQRAVKSGMLPTTVRTPEAALMIVMKGEELGISPMQAFASINIINGTPRLSAELVCALVKRRTDVCKYLRYVDGDDTYATWETWRVGEPNPVPHTFTMAKAVALGLSTKDNYKKQPATMLRWRAGMDLARLVYPELTLGLRDPDEMDDVDEEPRQARVIHPRQTQAAVVDAEVVEPAQPAQVEQTTDEQIAAWVARYEAIATVADFKAVHGEFRRTVTSNAVQLGVSAADMTARKRLGITKVGKTATGDVTVFVQPKAETTDAKIKIKDGETGQEVKPDADEVK